MRAEESVVMPFAMVVGTISPGMVVRFATAVASERRRPSPRATVPFTSADEVAEDTVVIAVDRTPMRPAFDAPDAVADADVVPAPAPANKPASSLTCMTASDGLERASELRDDTSAELARPATAAGSCAAAPASAGVTTTRARAMPPVPMSSRATTTTTTAPVPPLAGACNPAPESVRLCDDDGGESARPGHEAREWRGSETAEPVTTAHATRPDAVTDASLMPKGYAALGAVLSTRKEKVRGGAAA